MTRRKKEDSLGDFKGRKSFRRKKLEGDAPAFECLTDMQKQFVLEYVASNFDRTHAVKASGSKASTPNAIKSQAHNWLNNPTVNEAVDDEIYRRAQEMRVSTNRVVTELAKIAFANADDFFEWEGGEVVIKSSKSLSRDKKAAVQSIKSKRKIRSDRDGNETQEIDMELKLYDKQKALELLGKHVGMFKENVLVGGLDGGSVAFDINWGEEETAEEDA